MLFLSFSILLILTSTSASPFTRLKHDGHAFLPPKLKRQSTANTQGPFTFSNTTDLADIPFGARDVWLNSSSGMMLTCVNCALQGQFTFSLNMTLDADGLDAFDSAASDALGAAASNVASDLASATAAAASDIASLTSSIASIVESGAASAVSDVTSLAGEATSALIPAATSIIGGLESFFRRQEQPQVTGLPVMPDQRTSLHPRDDPLETLLQSVIGSLSVELNQDIPFEALFNLEFLSGSEGITIPLFPLPDELSDIEPGSISAGPLVTHGASTFPLPIPGLDLIIGIPTFGISLTASLAPDANVTLPVAANLTLAQPLSLDLGGASGEIDEPSVQVDQPIVNAVDPNGCLNLAVGPAAIIGLVHKPTNTKISFSARLNLPSINVCFSDEQNVDASCNANGPISQALQITTDLDVGLALNDTFTVGGETLFPSLTQDIANLSSELNHNFQLSDSCLDLAGLSQGSNGTQQSLAPASSSQTSTTVMATTIQASTTVLSSTTYSDTTTSTILPSMPSSPGYSAIMSPPYITSTSYSTSDQMLYTTAFPTATTESAFTTTIEIEIFEEATETVGVFVDEILAATLRS